MCWDDCTSMSSVLPILRCMHSYVQLHTIDSALIHTKNNSPEERHLSRDVRCCDMKEKCDGTFHSESSHVLFGFVSSANKGFSYQCSCKFLLFEGHRQNLWSVSENIDRTFLSDVRWRSGMSTANLNNLPACSSRGPQNV